MENEKSCGAVVYRYNGTENEYLIVLNKKNGTSGHWGFPKGHREGTENEYETASREILEEVGISVVFCGSAKAVTTYSPKENITKDVVYFLATIKNNEEIKLQSSEIAEYKWCNYFEAKRMLTFDANILDKLIAF